MKISINDDMNLCTGCYACRNACTKKCIVLKQNNEGFVYPSINYEECISCGKCRQVCPVNKDMRTNPIKYCYSGHHIDKDILRLSTSGAIFTALSQVAFSKDGVVFGAQYNEDQSKVIITYAENMCDIDKYRISKYYQSDVGDCYSDVKAFLDRGRAVLYTGTPCQVAGLCSFLGKDYANLVTMDFVCHGVASPGAFAKYKKDVEIATKSVMTDYCFRDNIGENKFIDCMVSYKLNRTKHTEKRSENPYSSMFVSAVINRKCCAVCPYASVNRVSDVTVADKIIDITEEEKALGSSFIIVNTEKGAGYLQAAKHNLVIKEESLQFVIDSCTHLRYPTTSSKYREEFFGRLQYSSFSRCVHMVEKHKKSFWKRVKSRMKREKKQLKKFLFK